MDDLKKKGSQIRSKINMHEPHEVKYWTKELGVDKDQLQKLVDKVVAIDQYAEAALGNLFLNKPYGINVP
jgi:Protein of unknown function (DUF3606)